MGRTARAQHAGCETVDKVQVCVGCGVADRVGVEPGSIGDPGSFGFWCWSELPEAALWLIGPRNGAVENRYRVVYTESRASHKPGRVRTFRLAGDRKGAVGALAAVQVAGRKKRCAHKATELAGCPDAAPKQHQR